MVGICDFKKLSSVDWDVQPMSRTDGTKYGKTLS